MRIQDQYPGSKTLGIADHPRDGLSGWLVRLANGTKVLWCGGVIRTVPQHVEPIPRYTL